RPAGPRGRLADLWPARRQPAVAKHAPRPDGAWADRRLRVRSRLCHRSPRRDHGFREERRERTDPRHTTSLHLSVATGIALSAALLVAVPGRFCLPHRAATALKPRRDHPCIRGSARASAHFPTLALDGERLEETA